MCAHSIAASLTIAAYNPSLSFTFRSYAHLDPKYQSRIITDDFPLPNPLLLRTHNALANVINARGAAEAMAILWPDDNNDWMGPLTPLESGNPGWRQRVSDWSTSTPATRPISASAVSETPTVHDTTSQTDSSTLLDFSPPSKLYLSPKAPRID